MTRPSPWASSWPEWAWARFPGWPGIDAEAHRGSLAEGGRTAGVLGNGIDQVFPGSNAPLGRRILAEGGCILSEFPPGEPPRPYHFPGRNPIISGLSRAVVVVQAPEGSGAVITAEYALEQGRELLVHADCLEGPTGAGTRTLANQGAQAVQVSGTGGLPCGSRHQV